MYKAFFALVKAGLWEREVRLSSYGKIDFKELYRLASEQQVVGLVMAGMNHVVDMELPRHELTPFRGDTLKLEQRNQAMNQFIARLFSVFCRNGASAFLVKGQGIAQCYERPLWRACGDIDLLLDEKNYQIAKVNMLKKASSIVEEEDKKRKHLALFMDRWVVELHGTLNHRFFPRVNRVLCEVQDDLMHRSEVRLWNNNGVDISLPTPDEDVIFVFSHIMEHFFGAGVGLRQICDWCRLLYTYGETIDRQLLERRLRQMKLIPEWKVFATFAVEMLDMQPEYMPLYIQDDKITKKATRLRSSIIKTGNFGQNRDTDYIFEATFLKKKAISFRNMCLSTLRQFSLFPMDTLYIFRHKIAKAIRRAVRGE